MPVGPFDIQIARLLPVEQAKRDQLGDDATEGHPEHRTGREVDRIGQSHRAHDDDDDGHDQQESTIYERTDDLGAIPAKAELVARRALGETCRNNRQQNTSHGRERVHRIAENGDGACPQAHSQLNDEVNARQPCRNREGTPT